MAHTRRIHKTINSIYPGSGKFYTPCIDKGEVVFTGPDAISNQKVTILDPTYVGIGTMSPEGTSSVEYLWRPGRRWAFPPSKSTRVGAYGWGLHLFHDAKRLKSGHQIERGTFRQALEDRHTHLYQNPWYPDPRDEQSSNDYADGSSKDQHSCSRQRQTSSQCAKPGLFRSYTPTPSGAHSNNWGTNLIRRPKSCTPAASQRARSGSMSSSTSVQSQLYVL